MKKYSRIALLAGLVAYACSFIKETGKSDFEHYCLMDSLLCVDKSIDAKTAEKIISRNPLPDTALWVSHATLDRITSKKFKRFKLTRIGVSKNSDKQKDTCVVVLTDNAGWVFQNLGTTGCPMR